MIVHLAAKRGGGVHDQHQPGCIDEVDGVLRRHKSGCDALYDIGGGDADRRTDAQ